MEHSIILHNIQPEQLAIMLASAAETAVKKAFAESSQNTHSFKEDKLLSRKEAAKLLKVTLPTLDKYAEDGVIVRQKVGRRVLYSENELRERLRKDQKEH